LKQHYKQCRVLELWVLIYLRPHSRPVSSINKHSPNLFTTGKIKNKASFVRAIKACGGKGDRVPFILNFGTRLVEVKTAIISSKY
jgi:hypothetical protein